MRHAQGEAGILAVRRGRFTGAGSAAPIDERSWCGERRRRERGRRSPRGAPDELRVRVCVDGGIEAERPARRRGDHRRARVRAAVGGPSAGGGRAKRCAGDFDETVSAGTRRAAREYFLEEPEFAAVVEFFEYSTKDRQGDGGSSWWTAGAGTGAPGTRSRAGARAARRRTIDAYIRLTRDDFLRRRLTRAIPGEAADSRRRLGNAPSPSGSGERFVSTLGGKMRGGLRHELQSLHGSRRASRAAAASARASCARTRPPSAPAAHRRAPFAERVHETGAGPAARSSGPLRLDAQHQRALHEPCLYRAFTARKHRSRLGVDAGARRPSLSKS